MNKDVKENHNLSIFLSKVYYICIKDHMIIISSIFRDAWDACKDMSADDAKSKYAQELYQV